MGADGGSIATRSEMTKVKKRAPKADKSDEPNAKWTLCALSDQKLRPPVMSCLLGRMYNKDAIIEYLLNKGSRGAEMEHVHRLKDLTELKLTPCVSTGRADSDALFMCPITRREMVGSGSFCFYRPCGCVISQQALLEMKEQKRCLVCSESFTDTIMLNPTGKDLEDARSKLPAKKKKRKLEVDGEGSEKSKRVPSAPSAHMAATAPLEEGAEKKKYKSKALESIFKSSAKGSDTKPSELFQNTFNRY